jgi:hypothetical protein
MMEHKRIPHAPESGYIIDLATLYLFRQGVQWIIVIESPRVSAALPLPRGARDAFDARFALLALAHRACPDAVTHTCDGAAEVAEYDWRVEVRGVQRYEGGLGEAVYRELTTRPFIHRRRLVTRRVARGCRRGWCAVDPGRPRVF